MNYSRCAIHKYVCVSLLVFFFIHFGCAAGKPIVENPAINEPAGSGENIILEKKSIESSEVAFKEDLISSPFGNIPIKKSPEPLPESLIPTYTETAASEKPIKMANQGNINKKGKDDQTVRNISNPIVAQTIDQAPVPVLEKNNPENNEAPSNQGGIVLNFDNADLYEVVRTIGEILQLNYIVDPNVRGRVTINTAGRLSREELFPVFFQILEANGLTAIKEGNLYKIIRMKEATQFPLSTRMGDQGPVVAPGERMVIQIIPLQFISSQ
jgi:hypothetical protein